MILIEGTEKLSPAEVHQVLQHVNLVILENGKIFMAQLAVRIVQQVAIKKVADEMYVLGVITENIT